MLLKGIAGKRIPLYLPCSTTTTAANKTGAWRFFRPVYQEKTAPCTAACPNGENIPGVEMLVARSALKEAWRTIAAENPFPSVCGRVCFHPCEQVCNRGQLDEPVAIRQLERFVGDRAIEESWALSTEESQTKKKTAAVIGAGPAGLAAAYFLVQLGYGCEVFEARSAPGGLLRWGIPAYRLPVTVLEAEVENIRRLGVRINCNTDLQASQLNALQNRYDALIIACGYGRSIGLGIRGAEHALDGLSLLNEIRHRIPSTQEGRVAVIGGGNTAVDVARSLVRLGAEPTIVYRRRREDMPAFAPEVSRALEEGVQLRELAAPIHIHADQRNGQPSYTLTLQKMIPGKKTEIGRRARVVPLEGQTETLQVERVVSAIGADAADHWLTMEGSPAGQLQMSHCHLINDRPPVLLAGDLASPVKSVSDAIASGKQAAVALDLLNERGAGHIRKALAACRVGAGPAFSMAAYLENKAARRKEETDGSSTRSRALVDFDQINLDYFESARRVPEPYLTPADRRVSFSECETGLGADAARSEARRCFNCGTCSACGNCRRFCPEAAVMVDKADRHIDLEYCKGCGVCVTECPCNAMAMEE